MIYEDLIKNEEKLKATEVAIGLKKQEFEDSIQVEKALMDDLKEKNTILRQEVILIMDKEKKDSEKFGDYNITKSNRRTVKVTEPKDLISSIQDNDKTIKDLGFDTVSLIENNFESQIIITNKKAVNEVIDAYEKVEGKLLNGVEEINTPYITIKSSK